MKLVHTIARQFAMYSFAFGVSQFVTVLLAVFVRNRLGPAEMGVWVALQVVMSYARYSDFGLAIAANRDISFHKGKNEIEEAEKTRHASFTFTLASTVIVSAGIAAAALISKNRTSPLFFHTLLTLAFLLLFQRMSTFCLSMVRAEKAFDFISRYNVYSSFVNAALTVALIYFFRLYGFYLSMILSYFFNFLYLYKWSPVTFKIRWSWADVRPLLKTGLGMIAVNMAATFFLSIDKFSIVTFMSLEALGLYSIVLMFGQFVMVFPNNLGVILFPYQNEAFGSARNPEELKKFMMKPNLFLASYAPILVAGLWILAPWLVGTFMPKYIGGIPALKIGLFGTLVMVIADNMGNAMITFKRHLWMVPVPLVLGALMFVVNALWIKNGLGLDGVAAMELVFFLIQFLIYSCVALVPKFGFNQVRNYMASVLLDLGLYFVALMLGDRWFPGNDPKNLAFKFLLAGVVAVPMLIKGEKAYGVFNLIRSLFLKKALAK